MKIRPVYNFILLRKSWIGGIVIYPFIFFKRRREEVSDTLFRHEMQHVYQIEEHGWLKYYISYLWESMRHGYEGNKYEIEAEAVKNQPLTPYERSVKNS